MTSMRESHQLPAGRGRRTIAVLAAANLLVLGLPLQAFDPGIHETTITESVLTGRGFDADSADEVGDSNFWTDTFEASSADAHADNNQLGPASTRLRSKMRTIRDSLAACERRDALDALGEALHTVQDVYSHSNSVDNGIAIPDILNMSNGTARCDPAANFAPGGLVTGYFSVSGFLAGLIARPPNPRGQCIGKPANDCCHFDLNKDNSGKPNGGRHGAAVDAAKAATGNYLDLVEQDIRDNFPADRAAQLIKMLKRKQRTVMFVIDDTGSMGNDIAGVRSAVNSFLNQLVASDEAPTLGLVTFKDNVSNRGLTCDIDSLRSQVNALFASGGGDCPEASNSALLSAVFTFPRGRSDIQLQGGRILLATDASARDASLGPRVQSEAAIRGISIDAILTGDCVAEDGFEAGDGGEVSLNEPEADPAAAEKSHTGDPLTSPSARTQLRALTEQTGGVLFNVSRLEVDDVVPTLLQLSNTDSAVILTRRLDLQAGVPAVVDVPVDETFAQQVTFMVTSSTSAALPAVTLQRPDGSVVQPTDPDTTRRTLSSVVSYAMRTPAPGLWRLTAAGNAPVVVRAFGGSPLRIDGLRFFSAAALPDREEVELGRIEGQPAAGTPVIADLRLTAAPSDAGLFLRRSNGGPVADLPLSPTDGSRRFRASFTMPGEAFLIEVEGTTAGGHRYLRQIQTPILPQLVALAVSPNLAIAPPGGTATLDVTVTNAATAPATYALSLTRALPWPVVLPPNFTVAPGAAVTVPVQVTVPAGTVEGTRNDLTIQVQDVAVPTTRNSISVAVVAGPVNRPPVCDQAAPTVDRLWPPDHELVAVGIAGVSDPDGDAVSVAVTGITQDEAVDAPGSGNTAPDGDGLGSDTARVRAERRGGGDGRVYAIQFTADDGKGGSCTGEVRVGVPHSVQDVAVDSGQAYDSTVVP